MKYILIILTFSSCLWAQNQGKEFKGVDLESFTQFVSKTTGKSILYDNSLRGRKMYLLAVNWKNDEELFKVFQSVMEYNGFILETVGQKGSKIIKVKRNILGPWTQTPVIFNVKDLEKEQDTFITMVIPLKHVSAREVQTTLRALRMVSPQGGNLAGIESSNTVLVTDYSQNVKRIHQIIQLMDRPKIEVVPHVRNEKLKIEGQTIAVKIGNSSDVFAEITAKANVSIQLTDAKGLVLAQIDKGNSKIHLSNYLKEKQGTFHIQFSANETAYTKGFVEIKALHKGEKKNSWYQFWALALSRSLPEGKKIKFTLELKP